VLVTNKLFNAVWDQKTKFAFPPAEKFLKIQLNR